MLNCCNCDFRSCYCHVVANKENFYRRIEFGICPKCGVYKFLDFRLINGEKKCKKLTGKAAERAYEKSLERIEERNSYSKSKQNFYYGDFVSTKKKDSNGNPIYLQLRKNFNKEFEILGEIKTRVFKIT